jgi:hypothetical protein
VAGGAGHGRAARSWSSLVVVIDGAQCHGSSDSSDARSYCSCETSETSVLAQRGCGTSLLVVLTPTRAVLAEPSNLQLGAVEISALLARQ